MSRTDVKRIIKNVKESSEIQSLPGRLRRTKIPKTLECKLVRDLPKNHRTTAKSLVNDLAKSGFKVSKKTVTPRRTTLLHKRHWQAGRLKFA